METDYIAEKEQWKKFYQKHFFLELNLMGIFIPNRPIENTWKLLIVAQGVTLNQVYKGMARIFDCWKYVDDLDATVIKNIRTAHQIYAIWVRDEIEGDQEYIGKSTNQADPTMTIGMTLLERMIYEMTYFEETGNHLDIKGITYCTASRDKEGNVPSVLFPVWGKIIVNWFSLDASSSLCSLRRVVS